MGDKLLFGFLHVFLLCLSRMPFWVLYRLSDLLYVNVYFLFRYRRTVVAENFRLAFPKVEEKKLRQYQKAFYRHFCDLILETLKLYTLSDRALLQRVKLVDDTFATEIQASQKGALLWGSHYGNFEWMMARLDIVARNHSLPTAAVYTPIKQKAINRILLRLRQRRGLTMLPMKRAMYEGVKRLKTIGMFGMIGDQSPHHGMKLYFSPFLNRPTAFHLSIAKVILRTESLAYYVEMQRVKRGHYTLELCPLPIQSFLPETDEQIQALTDHYVQALEDSIQAAPPFWLWSHRRWKHRVRPGDQRSAKLGKAFDLGENDG